MPGAFGVFLRGVRDYGPGGQERGGQEPGGQEDECAMTGQDRTDDAAEELRGIVRDWITVWQSELAAAAADREAQESWQSLLALWAGAANAMMQAIPAGMPSGGHTDPGGPRTPAGAATVAAAPDASAAEVERLGQRIGELERRLANLERGGG